MIIKSAALLILIMFLTLFLVSYTFADKETLNETDIPSLDIRDNEEYSLFDIRIISPDMLNTVIQNNKNAVTPLKIKKGENIGAVKDGVLYLRGDLNEKEFPLNESFDSEKKDKISEHLTDILFGLDNTKTNFFPDSKKYLIWFDQIYYNKDLSDVRNFTKEINDLSQTVTFEDEDIGLPTYLPNYNPIPYQYYKIGFIDKDLFDDKLDDRKTDSEQLLKEKTGKTVGIVSKDRLWLLNDLKGDERTYYLYRGLLFSMGFHGDSSDQNSFFYEKNFDNWNLSSPDKDAIKLVYGGRIKDGMDMNSIKKALGNSNDE